MQPSLHLIEHRGAAVEPVREEQRALGQLRQQRQRERPLRFALPAERQRQRIVQSHFE